MTEEKVIYKKGTVRITNLRAIFGDKTYAISNITSVTKKEKPNPAAFSPIAIITFGFAFLVIGFIGEVTNWAMLFLAVMMIGGGYFLAMLLRTEYSVQIGSAAGEEQAYTSKSIAEVSEIVQAINTAMIVQG
jgi:hypothetical protein